MLLEIDAVLRADDPFKLTSGMMSPVYIDAKIISSQGCGPRCDYGATSSRMILAMRASMHLPVVRQVSFAAWLAERMALLMQYVRMFPKGFGRDARIEGAISKVSAMLLSRIDDRWWQQAEFC